MADTSGVVDTTILLKYFPLNVLNNTEMEILAGKISVLPARRGKVLVESGQVDNKALLLLKGEIRLTPEDGESHTVEAGSEAFFRPISNTSPHVYSVKATRRFTFSWLCSRIIG